MISLELLKSLGRRRSALFYVLLAIVDCYLEALVVFYIPSVAINCCLSRYCENGGEDCRSNEGKQSQR